MQGANLKGTVRAGDGPCRRVTPEEVAHYQEFGWVKLSAFVRADMVELILRNAFARMGEDADSNAVIDIIGPGVEKRIAYFNAEYGGGLEIPLIRSFIEHVGKNGRALMSRSRPVDRSTGRGVRLDRHADQSTPSGGSLPDSRRVAPAPIRAATMAASSKSFIFPVVVLGTSSCVIKMISRGIL
jgi:hypothetical protein